MSQAQVTPEEAYYVVLRTVVAGNQANWNVMGHMAQLRRLMGVSDDLHKQYLEQIKADPEVCSISGQPPPPKRQRSTPAPATAGSKSKPAAAGNRPRPAGGRVSDGGHPAPAPPPPPQVQIPTYGLPNRKAPHEDPHGLVGRRVNIIQEDDSTVEGMVVDFNTADQTHVVMVNMGGADETCEPLPLVEYPDAYQDLGPHPNYVSPIPPATMPPPAARPRNSHGGGAAPAAPRPAGSKPTGVAGAANQKARQKTAAVRPAGGAAPGGAARLGQAPYNQAALDARLAVADLSELTQLLTAISKRERHIMAELEAAGLMDEAMSWSVMEREELVRQICAH